MPIRCLRTLTLAILKILRKPYGNLMTIPRLGWFAKADPGQRHGPNNDDIELVELVAESSDEYVVNCQMRGPMQHPETDFDPIDLSALLASRVCHDLINPVGAIHSGLSMLEEDSDDETMREMSENLVREGTEKALALLSYARLAYGAAGGYGAEIKMEDAERVLTDLFKTTKADLVWKLPNRMAPKNFAKVALILGAAGADCVPRGGTVEIAEEKGDIHLTITGDRLFLNDEFIDALSGHRSELKPKFAPAYIAGQFARENGGSISATRDEKTITMIARFGAMSVPEMPTTGEIGNDGTVSGSSAVATRR